MKKLIWGLIVLLFLLSGCTNNSESGEPTLPGADEIYPTVMVEGQLYKWRQGRAVLDKLPDSSKYEADIEHSNEKVPTENYEFVSTFDVTGEIYTIPDDNSCVYLLISTDWMQEKVVVFDKVSKTVNSILSGIIEEGIVSARFDSHIPNYIYDIEDLTIINELINTLDGANYEVCDKPKEPLSSIELIYITTNENEYCLGVINNSAFLVSVNGEENYYICSHKDSFLNKLLDLEGRK